MASMSILGLIIIVLGLLFGGAILAGIVALIIFLINKNKKQQ